MQSVGMGMIGKLVTVMRRGIAGAALGLALVATALALPAPDRKGSVSHTFDLYAGGLWVGEMMMTANVDEDRYVVGARLKTAGLVRAFFDASLIAETVGGVAGERLEPRRYRSVIGDEKKEQEVRIGYVDGVPVEVTADPPEGKKDYSLVPSEQGIVPDPLTGALSAFAPRANGFCDRRIEMYDGKHRFAIVVGPAAVDGNEMRCEALYERVAGFKPKMMRPERRTIPFTMWFERDADGLWQPSRARMPTDYVPVTLVRRD